MSYTIWARRICLAVFFLLFLASSIFAFFQRGPMPATGQRWRILGTSCPKDAEIYDASTDLQARFAVNTSLTAEEWRTLRPAAATDSVPTTACILANGYAYGPGDGQRGAGIYSLYRFNLFFFATPRSSQTYSSFQTSMFEACPPDKVEERHSAVIQQSWNLGTFYAAPLMQDKMLVNTWEMLIIIFSVSMVCEYLRLRKSSPEDVGMRALRWVEYALTSPFILVIIAIAGYIRDQRLLLLLFAGQFALIPYGYALEAELERVYAQNVGWRKWVLFVFLFVAAWILHVLLWFVLAQTTLHNIAAALPCTGWGPPDRPTDTPADYETLRTAFTVLLYFELVLFSLFGLVLPISMWRCRGCKIEDVWASNEALYAALNVSSKALLFVLIAIIVFGMPPEVVL